METVCFKILYSIYLSKSSFSKHLADLVQLQLGLRWFLVLLEAVSDQLPNQVDLLRSRRKRLGILLVLLDVLQDVLLIRIENLTLVPLRVLARHDLLVVRVCYELRQVNRDNIFQLLVHLCHSWISSRLLLQHIVLPGSLYGAVFWRVDVTQLGVGKHVLTRLAIRPRIVSSGVLAFVATVNHLADYIFLLLKILIDVLLAHLILAIF